MDLEEEIRKIAYEFYEKSGKIAGRDLDNWLEAEKLIIARQGGEKILKLHSLLLQKEKGINK